MTYWQSNAAAREDEITRCAQHICENVHDFAVGGRVTLLNVQDEIRDLKADLPELRAAELDTTWTESTIKALRRLAADMHEAGLTVVDW